MPAPSRHPRRAARTSRDIARARVSRSASAVLLSDVCALSGVSCLSSYYVLSLMSRVSMCVTCVPALSVYCVCVSYDLCLHTCSCLVSVRVCVRTLSTHATIRARRYIYFWGFPKYPLRPRIHGKDHTAGTNCDGELARHFSSRRRLLEHRPLVAPHSA